VVAAYLEELAGQYFDWQEACPVMRPGSVPPGPADPRTADGPPAGGELIQARLQLASAAQTVLGTGLRLLGIAAPSRI
jgi:arginyl-tRNA synthetase